MRQHRVIQDPLAPGHQVDEHRGQDGIEHAVAARQECDLEGEFGKAYRRYRNTARRWLGKARDRSLAMSA
jgi:hypothetical protein